MLLMFCLKATLNVTFIIFRYAPVAQHTNSYFLVIWTFEITFSPKNKKVCFKDTYI